MSEEINYIPEPPEIIETVPEKKNKKTLWIILAVVAVVLLCCCLVSVIGVLAGLLPQIDTDQFEIFYKLTPYLGLI